jgi:hypothetical protein
MILVIRVALGLVFAWSAAAKIVRFDEFVGGVEDYQILPAAWSRGAAIATVLAELVLAATHLAGQSPYSSAMAGILFLSTLTVAVSVNLVRGRSMPCYCTGSAAAALSAVTVARLALLLGAEFAIATNPVDAGNRAARDMVLVFAFAAVVAEGGAWATQLGAVGRLLANGSRG